MRDRSFRRKLAHIRDVLIRISAKTTENIMEIVRGISSSLKSNSGTVPQITSRLILVTKFVIHNSRKKIIAI
jgi:hypothetical protein